MNTMILKLYVKFQDLMSREEGQDLIEYALVASLIALGSVTLISGAGKSIVTIFTTISTDLSSAAV
jgi:pilus assembly protein Flp/PilA